VSAARPCAARRRSGSRAPGATRASVDCGSVTAETAVVLPVLLVVLAASIWVLACVAAQLRCVDAAHAAARAAARGDAPGDVEAAGRAVAPPGAQVSVTRAGDQVHVAVTAEVRPFGAALRVLPGVPVAGRATADAEDREGR
jgi:Flp pilus assembly protein TadG